MGVVLFRQVVAASAVAVLFFNFPIGIGSSSPMHLVLLRHVSTTNKILSGQNKIVYHTLPFLILLHARLASTDDACDTKEPVADTDLVKLLQTDCSACHRFYFLLLLQRTPFSSCFTLIESPSGSKAILLIFTSA